MSPAPSSLHQRVSLNLTRELDKFFLKTKCEMYVTPFDVRLINFKKSTKENQIVSVIQPDLCIVCDKTKIDEKGCLGSLDLVIEILPPTNSKKEMGLKFDLYEENLVNEYWIVNPTDNTVLIYILQNEKYIGLKPFQIGDKIESPFFHNLKID